MELIDNGIVSKDGFVGIRSITILLPDDVAENIGKFPQAREHVVRLIGEDVVRFLEIINE